MTEEQVGEAQSVLDFLNQGEGRFFDIHLDTTPEGIERVSRMDEYAVCPIYFTDRRTGLHYPFANGEEPFLIEHDFETGNMENYLANIYTNQLNQLVSTTTPFYVGM